MSECLSGVVIITLRNIDADTNLIVLKMGEIEEDGTNNEIENLIYNFEGKLLLTGN